MGLPKRYVTVIGLLIAIAVAIVDEVGHEALVQLFGEHGGTRIMLAAAFVAAVGRALIKPTKGRRIEE